MSELLPDPATPVITVNTPVGISTLDILQVVGPGIHDGQLALCRTKTVLDRNGLIHVAARQRIGVQQVTVAALEDDGTAARSGAWPDIEDVVGDL